MTNMLEPGDALIVCDAQNDFLPGGALAIAGGDEILDPLNRCLESFAAERLPVFATLDWHPPGHCSFKERGGPWPAHCVIGTEGAQPSPRLFLPSGLEFVRKGSSPGRDAYSGFQGTGLEQMLRERGARRLVIGGLAGDYCVSATARDALLKGFEVVVLTDAVRSVDPAAGRRALCVLEGEGAALAGSEFFQLEVI